MAFYQDRIYPHLVRWVGNPKPILELRKQIVPLAQGKVLEIGVGSGANFVHYDVAKVTTLYALEPNPEMLQLAERERRRTKLSIEFLDAPGERIPLGDSVVDTVVSTFTLCTIPAVVEAIRSIARVLKPGGKLIFLENSVAADPRVRRWQKWWEPIQSRGPVAAMVPQFDNRSRCNLTIAVVPMVVPIVSSPTIASSRARYGARLKHNGQRWHALAVQDYESRALPLSYGGGCTATA